MSPSARAGEVAGWDGLLFVRAARDEAFVERVQGEAHELAGLETAPGLAVAVAGRDVDGGQTPAVVDDGDQSTTDELRRCAPGGLQAVTVLLDAQNSETGSNLHEDLQGAVVSHSAEQDGSKYNKNVVLSSRALTRIDKSQKSEYLSKQNLSYPHLKEVHDMLQKLSSLVYRLSSAAVFLALPACRGPSTHSEPLITADKLSIPLSTTKPQPKREMVMYHLRYVSAHTRILERTTLIPLTHVFPVIPVVHLGWFGSTGDFQTTPECTAQADLSLPLADLSRHECDISLPLGESAVFGVLGELHKGGTPEPQRRRFLQLNHEDLPYRHEALGGLLMVTIEGREQALVPLAHMSHDVTEEALSKAWKIEDQWLSSTPCPWWLPRLEKGVCAPLR